MTRYPSKRRFLLGKKLLLEGEIKITELSLALRFILLEQNELPKKQKRNLKSDLKEKLTIIKRINKLFCVIKLLLKSKFYSLNGRLQINEILLESAFCLFLIILILLLFLLLPFASGISSAWQIWQLLQQLLQLLFGSGPG
jgi:hypothetical protein